MNLIFNNKSRVIHFCKYISTFKLYGHEIEMYTVEQGEKRDKRQ